MHPLLQDLTWAEDGHKIVSCIVDDVLENAAAVIAEKAIVQQIHPFTQQWVMAQLAAAVNYQFMQNDEGDDMEGDAAGAWEVDDEPVPSPVDTWATHSVPVRHRPCAHTPVDAKATIESEEAARLRKEMLRRRSRQFSLSMNIKFPHESAEQISEESETAERTSREQVKSALAIPGEEYEAILPKRFRSASTFERVQQDQGLRQGGTKDLLNRISKPRVSTAQFGKRKENTSIKPDISKRKDKSPSTRDKTDQTKTAPKVQGGPTETMKVLNPIRMHQDREASVKSTLDEILSQQSERELKAITRIARETNGSFAYDYTGNLIPVKKVDGASLPKYNFQTKIAISTTPTNISGSDEMVDTKGKAQAHIPRIPKQPKLRKTAARKVKVV